TRHARGPLEDDAEIKEGDSPLDPRLWIPTGQFHLGRQQSWRRLRCIFLIEYTDKVSLMIMICFFYAHVKCLKVFEQ
ncbi:unnamed protein product, partial [Larinioides sclopetarius]